MYLDVGTGRGLLLVGAAKRLTTGRAVGLDIWKASDLSGNAREKTEAVLQQEGVPNAASCWSARRRTRGCPDASFEVILSNLCLHNISKREERDQACREIARILKPGGVAVISDFVKTGQYAEVFRAARACRCVAPIVRGMTFHRFASLEVRKPGSEEAGRSVR